MSSDTLRHEAIYMNLDVVCFDFRKKQWARPVTTHTKDYNKWMADVSEVSRLHDMTRYTATDKRVVLEAVHISDWCSTPGKTCWMLGAMGVRKHKKGRVWSSLTADCYVVPGHHVVSSALVINEWEAACPAKN